MVNVMQTNPFAYSPRMAGSDHTDHKLLTEHTVLTTTPVALYTSPGKLSTRFINCLFVNVGLGSVYVTVEHYKAENTTSYIMAYQVLIPPREPQLMEGGDVALSAIEPFDEIRISASVDNECHCHLTIEENHARLLG